VAIVFRKLERTEKKIFQVRANLVWLIWMKHTVEWQTSLCPYQDLIELFPNKKFKEFLKKTRRSILV
jgi:hypothetical protein